LPIGSCPQWKEWKEGWPTELTDDTGMPRDFACPYWLLLARPYRLRTTRVCLSLSAPIRHEAQYAARYSALARPVARCGEGMVFRVPCILCVTWAIVRTVPPLAPQLMSGPSELHATRLCLSLSAPIAS